MFPYVPSNRSNRSSLTTRGTYAFRQCLKTTLARSFARSFARPLARSRTSPQHSGGEYETKSVTGLEPATFVRNWKMGFLLRPSFELSRNAATGFFSDVSFVFLAYRAHVPAPRKLGENSLHRRQRDDLRVEAVRRGGLKLHR